MNEEEAQRLAALESKVALLEDLARVAKDQGKRLDEFFATAMQHLDGAIADARKEAIVDAPPRPPAPATLQAAPDGHGFEGCTHFVEFSETIHGLMTRDVTRTIEELFEPECLQPLEWKVEKLRLVGVKTAHESNPLPAVAVGLVSSLQLGAIEAGGALTFTIRNDAYDPIPVRFRVWGHCPHEWAAREGAA